MIRMVQSSSEGHAKTYFADALSKSDYYLDDQELQGQFMGRVADRLQLAGPAEKETFFALCENVNPLNGGSLTPRTNEDRTIGYDINFHCPKSVSIVHALSNDDHVITAFQASVAETMKDIEADSKTRVRKDGAYEDRETGELLWADFTHQTARPVDGSLPDPHLHSHCFVFNVTWDKEEEKFKAGQFRDIKRDMPYYQAMFHKRLSDKLIDLGYEIRRTDKAFEIEGVPKSAIDLFAKRTDEIGQFAKEHGITDAKEKSELGARTRSKKQKGFSMAELKQEWRRQILECGAVGKDESDQPVRYGLGKYSRQIMPKECVDHALHHSFERASVMADRRILATAYRQSVGSRATSLESITEQFRADDAIIHVKDKYGTYCTTKPVLQEEKWMVDLARQGQGKLAPLYMHAPKINLEGQQAAAVEHLLTTPHRVSIIRGAAGSGKTTLMTEAEKHIHAAGKKLFVVAPSSQASRGVLVEEGFKEANTVAKLLLDKEMQKKLQRQVLWVDEAGLLGTKDMTALLTIATQQNARLILGGDTRQHSSVVRGDALRILNTVGGIRSAEVSKIYRQRNVEYRKAVEDLSKGNVKDAFDKLESIGSIQEVDPLNPNEELVKDYIATIRKGKSALIVSPTHKQGEQVTEEIRKKLKSARLLGKKEVVATKYDNLNLTEAEKSDWRNYKEGDVVQFNQNAPGIKRGSLWSVQSVSEKQVVICSQDGASKTLPHHKALGFDLYKQTEIALAKGDKVQITRNGFDEQKKRLDNGQALEVVSVKKTGEIILQSHNGKSTYHLGKEFGHLKHAYCITSHSSQGKTVDEIFISQPASTFPATDAKQFYVSVSRARDAAKIYTDDKQALLDHASQLRNRQSAIELVSGVDPHLEQVKHFQRSEYQQPTPEPTKQLDFNKQKDFDYEPGI